MSKEQKCCRKCEPRGSTWCEQPLCKCHTPQDKRMTLSEVFEGENSSLKQAYDEATQDKRCKPCQLENNLGTCDRNDCSNYSQDNGDLEEDILSPQEQPKEIECSRCGKMEEGAYACKPKKSQPKEGCCQECVHGKHCDGWCKSCTNNMPLSPSQPNEQEQSIEEIMDCVSGDNISYHAGKIRGILQELSASARSQERTKLKEKIKDLIMEKPSGNVDGFALLDYLNTEK